MVSRITTPLVIGMLLTGCGSAPSMGGKSSTAEAHQDAGSSGPAAAAAPAAVYTKLVDSPSAMPPCNTSNDAQLIYVKSSNQFQSCSGGSGSWSVVNVSGPAGAAGSAGATGPTGATGAAGAQGTPGIAIASTWSYHVDSVANSSNLGAPERLLGVYLADVTVTMFSDGSAFVSASGVEADTDTAYNGIYSNFSYGFMLPSGSAEQTKTFKINVYLNSRIRFKVTLSSTQPTIKASVDIDGNWANNVDYSFPLTRN